MSPVRDERILIERALHAKTRLVHHMRVDHRCTHILVPKEFLHRSNIVSILQEMRRERMSKCVTGSRLGNMRLVKFRGMPLGMKQDISTNPTPRTPPRFGGCNSGIAGVLGLAEGVSACGRERALIMERTWFPFRFTRALPSTKAEIGETSFRLIVVRRSTSRAWQIRWKSRTRSQA
jgi:hypothetical protein